MIELMEGNGKLVQWLGLVGVGVTKSILKNFIACLSCSARMTLGKRTVARHNSGALLFQNLHRTPKMMIEYMGKDCCQWL